MERSRQEIIELTDRMLAKLPEVTRELVAHYPNVSSVEIGLKRRNGQLTDEICYRVRVTEKVGDNALKESERIPREIMNYRTDVLPELTGINCDSASYDFMTGGIMIDAGYGSGTLGCFVTRDAEPASAKKIYFLTNYHVVAGEAGAVGDRIGQPSSPSGSNCCLCYDIATLHSGEGGTTSGNAATIGTVLTPAGSPNTIDAAIGKLLGQEPGDPKTVYFSNSIEQIGPVFGSAAPVVLDRVRKRGSKTDLTYGVIETTTGTYRAINKANPDGPKIEYNNCVIVVSPLSENTAMANEGDSGSALVNRLNQVVGLIGGVNATVTPEGAINPGAIAIAYPMPAITTRLGISVLSSGTTDTIPLSSITENSIKPVRAGNYVHAFEKRLRSIPEGEMFLQILLDHRNEVMDLINDNREVKVAWHRFNGPEYIGHILKNSSSPNHAIPPDINGYSLQNLLIKMSDVLERNGSRRLAEAVENYSAFAFSFGRNYIGVESLNTVLKDLPRCSTCGKPIHTSAHAQ